VSNKAAKEKNDTRYNLTFQPYIT